MQGGEYVNSYTGGGIYGIVFLTGTVTGGGPIPQDEEKPFFHLVVSPLDVPVFSKERKTWTVTQDRPIEHYFVDTRGEVLVSIVLSIKSSH